MRKLAIQDHVSDVRLLAEDVAYVLHFEADVLDVGARGGVHHALDVADSMHHANIGA